MQSLTRFQIDKLSRKIEKEYDIAIGYLEGWSTNYLMSSKVNAHKKIAWIHVDLTNVNRINSLDINIYLKADFVVSVSKECEKNNKKLLGLKNSVYLENILSKSIIDKKADKIDESEQNYFNWINFSGLRFISVNRIVNLHKGIDRSIIAASLLKDKGVKFLWYIIGEGPDMKINIDEIQRRGLEEYVRLIGKLDNPFPYIKKADLFVLPSRYEGKPMVITESMMLSTPVFVTKYASADEQVRNGITGIVVDNQDETFVETFVDFVINKFDKVKNFKENLADYDIDKDAILINYDEFFRGEYEI